MDTIYRDFAYYYDRFARDVRYGQLAEYVTGIFAKNNLTPSLIVDLGCGTGSFCMEMAARGYEMIGIDLSPDMLSCARQKAVEAGMDILYLNQDIRSMELYGTADVFTCFMDGINYITCKKDLLRLFRLVRNYLNPGGLFIFDTNSIYKYEITIANNVFYDISDEASYIWVNDYNKKSRICTFDLTFFVKDRELYRRFDEKHRQRAYDVDEISEMLARASLELCSIYGGGGYEKPSDKEDRVFFTARKQE